MAKSDNLFAIINALFSDKEYINSLTNADLSANAFMINRRLAIKYPLQAQVFNHLKINLADVVKFWSDYLYTGGRCPGWVYTPGAAKSKSKLESKHKLTNSQIENYAVKHGYNKKTLRTAIDMFGDEMINEILDYEKLMKQLQSQN